MGKRATVDGEPLATGHPARPWAWSALLVALGTLILDSWLAEDTWFSLWVLHFPSLPLVLLAVGVLVWSWRLRDGRSIVVSLGAVALAVHLGSPCWRGLLPQGADMPSGESVRVVAFNVQHNHGGPDAIAAMLRWEDPDIVAFEEASFLGDRSADSQTVVDALPGFHWYREANLAIASRWPIARRWVSDFKVPTHTWAIFAEVQRKGKLPILVSAAHFNPLQWDQFLSPKIGKLPDHLRSAGRIRERQAYELMRELAKVDRATPVIVCGDFNGPPRGRVYERLTSDLKDCFADSALGPGWTIPAKMPMMRLDYVFVRPASTVLSSRVLEDAGSDHRPLLAEIVP